MSAPSPDEMYAQGRVVVLLKRPDLKLAPADAADLPMRAAAAMGDLIVGYHEGRILALYLDGAQGDDLKALARDRGVEPMVAVAAIGSITFTHTPGPVGTIPTGTRIATQLAADGTFVTFTTTQDAVFGSGTASQTVSAACSVTGSSGNVAVNTITRILDVPSFDTTFSCSNIEQFAGGADDESDPDLRARVRGYQATLRRATIDAVVYGALTVPTVRVATLVESGVPGIGTLYIADGDGNSNSTMIAQVQTTLEAWRAATVIINVVGGVLVDEIIAFTLVVRTGVDPAALVDRARAAVVAAVNRLDVGDGNGQGTLYRQFIAEAARSVDMINILTVTVVAPAADVVPNIGQVIRTELDLVSGS